MLLAMLGGRAGLMAAQGVTTGAISGTVTGPRASQSPAPKYRS